MSSKQGGKAKPLKQPKVDKKEYDEGSTKKVVISAHYFIIGVREREYKSEFPTPSVPLIVLLSLQMFVFILNASALL